MSSTIAKAVMHDRGAKPARFVEPNAMNSAASRQLLIPPMPESAAGRPDPRRK